MLSCRRSGIASNLNADINDPKLGGGTAGKSCNTCHPGGKGLEGVGDKKEWKNPGGTFQSLEDAVNVCIEMALKGKALDVKSDQMKDLISYLKSLKPKASETPKKKAPLWAADSIIVFVFGEREYPLPFLNP